MSDGDMKRCSKGEACCHPDGPWLPATAEYFTRDSSRCDGLYPRCKICRAEDTRRWRAEHQEDICRWRAEHPDYNHHYYAKHTDEMRERSRRWRAEHPEEARESSRRYRAEHRDERREYNRHWYAEHPDYYRRRRAEHPEKMRAIHLNRRARLKAAHGHYTAEDIRLQQRMQTDKKGRLICWWCDLPIKDGYEIDHRIPPGKGGTNWPENIVLAHPLCNRHKSNKLPGEFCGRLL